MADTITVKPTIGILYLGELGSALAEKCLEEGLHVVTTLEHRSERTRRMCTELGAKCLPTIRDVVERADIVFSVVPPDAAAAMAKECVRHLATRKDRSVYVDLNAVGPETIVRMEKLFVGNGHGFVDATVHGLTGNVRQDPVIYVSGQDADYVAKYIPKSIEVRHIGGRAGAAATFKMLVGGLNYGLLANFLELCLSAREADLLKEFTEVCYEFYPGVMEVTDRLVPTLRHHARRHLSELSELEQTIELLGRRPGLAREVRRCFQRISDASDVTDDKQSDSTSTDLLQTLDLMSEADDNPGLETVSFSDRLSH